MLYNADQIREILPHRYPFLLVDRIEEVIDDKVVIAKKCVTTNEPFFQGHFPQKNVMPGVLLLEVMAQAGAVLLLSIDKYKGKIAYFTGVKDAKFRGMVTPGDVLDIRVELQKFKMGFGYALGTISVDGKVVCEAEISFAIGD